MDDKSMNWKTLSSEYLYRETWFTIRKDVCEAPDGKIISPYYVYEFPTWVSALAITEQNQVVMVRQYRHGIEQTIIEIPGGCVDDTDKNFEEAIARELLEETGYAFSRYERLGKISPNPSTNNNWMHMYLATGGVRMKEQSLDHNEDIVVELISLEELEALVEENKIVQALHLSTIVYGLKKLAATDKNNL
ncbi:MAG: NUDIX hydrolase [Chitinophagaceae bacterium]|nr:NUDIX hydrolase [Chitinophagaceae bacterium]